MRNLITLAVHELHLSLKARETFLIGLLMPAVMMILLGIAQSGNGDGPTIHIDVDDRDHSALSAQLVQTLQDEMGDSFKLCHYQVDTNDTCDLPNNPDADTITERLENTDALGAVIIPAGFGENLRQGKTATVQFQNSDELSAPTLAEQKIDAAISRLGGAITIARLTVDTADTALDAYAGDDAARLEAFDTVLANAQVAWEQMPVIVETEATAEETSEIATGFDQSGPGTATMFVLIFMLNTATALVHERETGTLQRLYTLPTRRGIILGGKLLGRYLFGVLQFTVLLVVGALMGVEWGSNLPGLSLIVLVYTFTCVALGMTLATFVRTSAQATNIALLMGLTLSPLGGAWWPMEVVPDVMQTIGHISPVAWAMDAFDELMFYSGTVTSILPMLGILLLMGTALFAFGVWNFKYD